MRPEIHARLIDQYHLVFFILGMPLIFLCVLIPMVCSDDKNIIIRNIIIFVLILALYFFIDLFLMELPVRCNTPGCKSWMEKDITTQISKFKAIIRYRCKSCNNIDDEIVFQLESGGGYDYTP